MSGLGLFRTLMLASASWGCIGSRDLKRVIRNLKLMASFQH